MKRFKPPGVVLPTTFFPTIGFVLTVGLLVAACERPEPGPAELDLPAPAAEVLRDPGPVPADLLPLEPPVERVALGFMGEEVVSSVGTGEAFQILHHHWSEEEGRWSAGEPLPFIGGDWVDRSPTFSPDGTYLLFASDRPADDPAAFDSNIWVAQREEGTEGEPAGWSAPWLLPVVHSPAWDGAPSMAMDGTLYFSTLRDGPAAGRSLYAAPFEGGMWTVPERIPEPVSSFADDADPYVAPDQTFLLFASNRDGPWHLYVSFREGDDWGHPQRLGEEVNTEANERAPALSSAGEVLLFVRDGELHAIHASRAGVERPGPDS